MKKFLFSFVIVSSVIFAQPQNKRPESIPIIPFETNVTTLPDTTGEYSIYYTYKIPYRLLIFERNNDIFEAAFRIMVEIKDEDDNLITRDIKDNDLIVGNFDETNNPRLVLQDYLQFVVKPGDYKINAIISDRNSSGERPLNPFDIDLKKINEVKVLDPLVVNSNKMECNGSDAFVLANSGGKIPFSNEEFDLVIPIVDTTLNELDIVLENNGKEIFSGKLENPQVNGIDINKCDQSLVLVESPTHLKTRNFTVKDVNKKLNEGVLVLKIKNDEKDLDEEINMNVIWFNKPLSLYNPEKAIELLSYIETESVVDSLLNEDEDDYPMVLQNYWSKFDPTPETSFNEIMFEYYSRADYAIKEFSSITNNNGAKSDRGMVYMKFGKPDKVDRHSSAQGEVVEVWTYSGPERNFTFIDKIGTGNFTLIEN